MEKFEGEMLFSRTKVLGIWLYDFSYLSLFIDISDYE